METKTAIFLRILLNRYKKGSAEIALKYLPEEIIKQITQVSITATDPKPLLEHPQIVLQKIHYSWLISHFQKLPKEITPTLISPLSTYQRSRIKGLLKLTGEIATLAPLIQNYISHFIYHLIEGPKEILPLEYLPETPFTPLGKWNKQELVELIEVLGIHDLSEGMRHIVDKKILKNAYNCLSSKEQQYLRICMHLKEKIITPPLGLEKWNGESDKLKSVLQTRGLVRLGKALSGAHPDFIWYLSHILDTGRGQALQKYYSQTAIPGITPALSQQLINLMNFLKIKE